MKENCRCDSVNILNYTDVNPIKQGHQHNGYYICKGRVDSRGTAVVQWLRYWATNRKVAVSIPDGVIILPIALWPGVDSASNRNEYQEYFLGVKAADACG